MFKFIKSLLQKWFPQERPLDPDNPRNGLLPSPYDARDLQAKDILGAIELAPLPERYYIPYILPVKNQGSEPACVGYSCSTIKDEKERREKNEFIGDGLWLYRQCKLVDGYNGPGTYFRIGLDRLTKVGIKPMPESPVQGEPAAFKIGGYCQVDCDFESLKRAIWQFGAILAGFYGDNVGWKTTYVQPPKNIEWGHAIAIIGFNKDYLIGHNSWGDGMVYIPKDYLPFESWAVLSDIPTQLNDVIKPKHFFSTDLYFGVDNAPEVKALQDCLKYLGCMDKSQISTGIFGSITLSATKVFQERYKINPVGRVGPQTREKLNLLFKD